MRVQRFLPLAFVFFVGIASGCQLALGQTGLPSSQKSKADKPTGSQTAATSTALWRGKDRSVTDKEFVAYRQSVLQKFVNDDFAWIDREASKVRLTKARLPGGYWKLRALYDALEEPQTEEPSNGEWKTHINKLKRWMNDYPRSITARVALGATWKNYAWKARGGGYSDTVTDNDWELFDKRLATASEVLAEAASLDEGCPHWFVVSLWIGIGQSWDRDEFERMFEAAVKLEPTYYYLYQTKATYLLPRWHGEEGEWERFVNESTLNVGGHEGDIIFFAVYSQMLSLHDINFTKTHKRAWPRLLGGFRSIEKLYGVAPHRLNEACFFAFGAGDHRTAVELFDRIGEDFDKSVWRSKINFEVLRRATSIIDEREKQKTTLLASKIR